MTDLIVMRLKDMKRVHPDQITARCAACNEEVGVYPSGQRMMKQCRLICQVCRPPGRDILLAPGAAFEPFETKPKGKSS